MNKTANTSNGVTNAKAKALLEVKAEKKKMRKKVQTKEG